MAEGHKKSFMLYFDNYPSIAALPADQRGGAAGAALPLRHGGGGGLCGSGGSLRIQFPNLTPETRMAYRFLAETIRRDTEKWVGQAAALPVSGNAPAWRRAGGNPAPPDRDDISWMRPHMERLRASMEKTPLD